MPFILDEIERKYRTPMQPASSILDELDAKYGASAQPTENAAGILDELDAKYGQQAQEPTSILDEIDQKYQPDGRGITAFPALAPPEGIKDAKRLPQPDVESSALGAAGRGVVRSALPTGAAWVAGVGGAKIGAAVGSPGGPIGAGIGALVGGLAAGIATYAGASKLQEWGLGKLIGEDKLQEIQAQQAADIQQHPVASLAGELAPQAVVTPFNVRNIYKTGQFLKLVKAIGLTKTIGTRGGQELANAFGKVVFGAGTQAGFSAIEAIKTGDVNPLGIGLRVLSGAFLTGNSPFAKGLSKQPGGNRALARIRAALKEMETMPLAEKGGRPEQPMTRPPLGQAEPSPLEATIARATEVQGADQVKGPMAEVRGEPGIARPAARVAEGGASEVQPTARAGAQAQEVAGAADRFAKVSNQMREDVKKHFAFSWGRMRDWMASAFRDIPRAILRRLEGTAWKQEMSDALDRTRGAGPEASRQYAETEARINQTLGRDIAPEQLDDYLFARRMIEATNVEEARGVTRKNPYGLTRDEARTFIAQQERALGPEGAQRLRAAADEYWGTMRKALDRLHEEGLLSDDLHAAMQQQQFYSPMDFIQHIDPDVESISPMTGKKISTPDSGIERLRGGSEEALITNWRYLLNQVVARTEVRIVKNQANRVLGKLAADPNNPLGAKLGTPKVNEAGEFAGYMDTPAGYEPVHYMDGGQPKQILLPAELARYWATSDPTISRKVTEIMGWLSGAQPVRALATGYNPEFAVRNAFVDSAYTWFRTPEYSKWLPVAMGQRTADMLRVAGDAWRGGPRTQSFIKNYGSMDFLSQQGGIFGKEWMHPTRMSHAARKVESFFAKLNTWSEIMGRLATQERAMRNGATPQQAALISRNTLDFNKGGWLTKAVDRMGLPYLNAAFRAADGLAESARKNPALFSFKVGQLMVVASGLAYWARQTSPKTMESIPDREKEGYWIVPLGDLSATDATGKPKYLYLRFRKDQSGRAIAATAETFTEKLMGVKTNGNKIAMGLSDLSPVDMPMMMAPIVSAMTSYAMNKNLWTREDIWRGEKVAPHLEYYSSTPDHLVQATSNLSKLGVEVSPERLRQASSRVFPYNAWTSMMGGTIDAMVGRDERVRRTLAERILEIPGIRTILGTTRDFDLRETDLETAKRLKIPVKNADGTMRATSAIRNDIDEATTIRNSSRQLLNNELDRQIQFVKAGQRSRADLLAWIRTVEDPKERQRLVSRQAEKLSPRVARRPVAMP